METTVIAWAAALQAVATIVLVCITIAYVRYTARQAEASEGQLHQVMKSETDREKRRSAEIRCAVNMELNQVGQYLKAAGPNPVVLPTEAWDRYAGEFLGLGGDALDSLLTAYGEVRACNAVATAWMNGASQAHQTVLSNMWHRKVMNIPDNAHNSIWHMVKAAEENRTTQDSDDTPE